MSVLRSMIIASLIALGVAISLAQATPSIPIPPP